MNIVYSGDPRAVPCPPSLQQSRDVHHASVALCRDNSAPFGLAIYAWPADGSEAHKRQLPLYYVPPPAAYDRSPQIYKMNLRGVQSGWYVEAEAGMHFEVRLTLLSKEVMRKQRRNAMQATLRVDGRSVNSAVNFFRHRMVGEEFTWTGFVERRVDKGGGRYEKKVRRFVFEKSMGEGGGDVGWIGLEVRVGMEKREEKVWVGDAGRFGGVGVGEKEAEKDGKSLKVGMGGVRRSWKKVSKVGVRGLMEVREAGVKIFVREKEWLKSRLIVEDGWAVGYERFCEVRAVGQRKEEVVDLIEAEQDREEEEEERIAESCFETQPDD